MNFFQKYNIGGVFIGAIFMALVTLSLLVNDPLDWRGWACLVVAVIVWRIGKLHLRGAEIKDLYDDPSIPEDEKPQPLYGFDAVRYLLAAMVFFVSIWVIILQGHSATAAMVCAAISLYASYQGMRNYQLWRKRKVE